MTEERQSLLNIEENSVLEVQKHSSLMTGLSTWINPKNGFTVLDLEFKADPAKRSEAWKVETSAGMPRSQFNREYGSQWIVYEGKGVYNDFDPEVHVVTGKIIVPRKARLVSGWDGGPNDVNIAWVLGVTGRENSILIIDEYAVNTGDINEVVEVAEDRLSLEWNKLGGFSLHICDMAIFTKSSVVKYVRAMADIMREHGMSPMPGEQSYAKRRNYMASLMCSLYKSVDGRMIPKFRVHERCTNLIAALNGGYAYPKMAGGVGGEFGPRPLKNKHSHIANACEYLVSRVTIAHQTIPYEGKKLPRMASSF